LIEGSPHMGEPAIACRAIDGEACMAHSQPWMATLLRVRLGTTPVLFEEEAQALRRWCEVVTRVDGTKDRVVRNPAIEVVDETLEEDMTSESLESGQVSVGLAHRCPILPLVIAPVRGGSRGR